MKEFADDNFKFHENGRKFSKQVQNTLEKGGNCKLQTISPFPTEFSKDLFSRQVKTRGLVWERVKKQHATAQDYFEGMPGSHVAQW